MMSLNTGPCESERRKAPEIFRLGRGDPGNGFQALLNGVAVIPEFRKLRQEDGLSAAWATQ